MEYLISIHDPDVAALTETWLHDGTYDSEFVPPDFEVYRRDCNNRGGGVALLKKKLKAVRMNDPASLEGLFCKIFCDEHCVRVVWFVDHQVPI